MQTKKEEKLENSNCRLKALEALCYLGTADDLIKDFLVAFLNYWKVQHELFMETTTQLQVLQFNLNRKTEQENEKAVLG